MHFSLIAQVASPEPLSMWIVVPLVIFGLGMVIFIHELGHFLVAKWCGVRCDKFYIGFDVPITIPIPFTKKKIKIPSALWKKKWGETEYGVGILPLGGYVKMLGQDDNPYRAREEMEKAGGHTLVKLTPAQMDAWKKAVEPIYADWVKAASASGVNGQAALDDLRKELATRGGAN